MIKNRKENNKIIKLNKKQNKRSKIKKKKNKNQELNLEYCLIRKRFQFKKDFQKDDPAFKYLFNFLFLIINMNTKKKKKSFKQLIKP